MKPIEERLIGELSKKLKMPAALKPSELGPNAARVDRELKHIMGEQQSLPPRPPQVITQTDIERALQELRDARCAELERKAAEEKPTEEVTCTTSNK